MRELLTRIDNFYYLRLLEAEKHHKTVSIRAPAYPLVTLWYSFSH
jgi:hypothetical protein